MALPSQEIYFRVKRELSEADIYLSDSEYSIPKQDWITGPFYNLYENWTRREGLYEWKEYHDCDNKSINFMAFAAMCHAKTMAAKQREGKKTVQGIAVGIVFYLINGEKDRGHAINILHTEKGIQFIEPQDDRMVKLSAKERKSAWMVIM